MRRVSFACSHIYFLPVAIIFQIVMSILLSWPLFILFAFTQINLQKELFTNPIVIAFWLFHIVIIGAIGFGIRYVFTPYSFTIHWVELCMSLSILIALLLTYFFANKTGDLSSLIFGATPSVSVFLSSCLQVLLYWRTSKKEEAG